MDTQWIIIAGNINAGFTVYGPFKSETDAEDYAVNSDLSNNLDLDVRWAPMLSPHTQD
jgi:hypothetical protein